MVTLERMEDGYLPLTVTSPPYNVDLGNNKFNKDKSYDTHDDNLTHEAYMESMKLIFSKLFQKTQSGGRCVINIGDGKNGRVSTHSDYIQMMSEIGWMPMANIVWNKRNVSARTAWGSYGSPSAPSLPMPFEYIMVFAKDSYKLPQPENKSELMDITKEEFVEWSLALWEFSGASRKKIGHPAPFPIELPLRCIKLFSWDTSVIYDPFMGSGTTALACLQTNRTYIGSEISEAYITLAENRIKELTSDKKVVSNDSQRTHLLGGVIDMKTHMEGVCDPKCWCQEEII